MIKSFASIFSLRFRNGYFAVRKTTQVSSAKTRFVTSGYKALTVWLMSCCLLSAGSGFAANTRTQTFQLNEGWNAVYLQVQPVEKNPEIIFSNSVVDIVATYDVAGASGQFSTDASVDKLRELGWGIWYAPAREDSFLSDLGSIYGNKAFLIHALESMSLSITGTVVQPDVRWTPDTFNLVGYTLDQNAPPTFAQFFNASDAHRGQTIYRLINGIWTRVQNPAVTPMRNGEAFWVYCNGGSGFDGPLSVETQSRQGIVLQNGTDNLILRNRADHPVQPTIKHVTDGAAGVPMAVMIDVTGENSESLKSVAVALGAGDWNQSMPALEAGDSIRVPLALVSDDAVSAETTSLLCIQTDLGTETWIPVTGLREDLQ